jgi:hypothetical protein
VKIQHLPLFFVIPRQTEADVMPWVKKHVVHLKDGRRVIAEVDMMNCRDSRAWYKKKGKKVVARYLVVMKYTKEIIDELDAESPLLFGRYLKAEWDSGLLRAAEEIKYQKSVRPQ